MDQQTAGAIAALSEMVRNLTARIQAVEKHEHKGVQYVITPKDDASTDQSIELSNAIAFVAASGGGVVRIAPGLLIACGVVLKSRVQVEGSGIEVTVVKAPNGTNTDVFVGENFASLTGTDGAGGIHSWSLRKLTIDGNKANNASAGWGLRVYGYGYVLRDVIVRNCRSGGIYSEWSGTVADAPGPDSMEAHLSGFVVHENAGVGIHWNGPHDSTWSHGHVYQNGTGTGTVVGVLVGAKGNGLQAVLCHVWGVNHTHPWRLDGNAFLVNCVGEGGSEAQVLIAANDCQVLGGDYFGTSSPGQYGIEIGTAGTAAGGTDINTKVLNCPGGGIRFTNDAGAGSRVIASVYQASGAGWSGTPNAGTLRLIQVAGGGTGGHLYVPDGADFQSQVILRDAGLSEAFVVVGGAGIILNVNQAIDTIDVVNGAFVRGFSDNFSTLKWQIDGAQGYAEFHNGGIRTRHVGAATPTGGNSGDIAVGNGKVWCNDAGTWKSVAVA